MSRHRAQQGLITDTMEATVIDPTPHQLIVRLEFDPEDPCAITATFTDPANLCVPAASWWLSRDTLDDGLSAPAGERDFVAWPYDDSYVALRIANDEGHLVVTLSRIRVGNLIRRSLKAVPRGQEYGEADLDAAEAELQAWIRDGVS